MANKIILKKTSTASKVPLSTDLEVGEIAVNLADQKLYSKNAGGTVILVGQGVGGSGDVVGGSSSTDNALARYDGTTGKLIQNSTAILDDSGNLDTASIKTDYADLDTSATAPAYAQGRTFWDSGNGTTSTYLNPDVTLQNGQEIVTLVYNGTGSTITNGSVVAVAGAQGQRPSVVLADADSEPTSASTLGIATQDIANGAEGFITSFGFIRGVNTSGFTAGAPIYLSQTAGGFTATRPSAPAHTVILGWVIKVNASSGEIFVHINNGWELDELHNVLITSPTSGNTLIYDASVGVWKNANITAGTGVSVTNGAGSITIANTGVTSVNGVTGAVTATNLLDAIKTVDGAGSGLDADTLDGNSSAYFQQALVSGTNIKTVNSTTLLGSGNLAVGTVTSVGASVPTGLTVSGSPITSSGTLAITYTAGYSIPTTASQTNWDTAYSDRLKWDGGSTGLTASTGRTSLGATTLGSNIFTITNPSAVTFPRFNADNTISALSATDFRTAIGAGTGSGTVTSVTGGTYLTGGTITTSGTLAVDATSANTASKVVARDASGNFSAGTITATLSGNATSATTATNATNVAVTTSATASAFKVPFANTTASTTGNYGLLQDSEATFTYNPSTNTLTVGTFSGALSGNATTATTLATGRTIAITGDLTYTSPSFNGSGNVTATGTLATVNSNVGTYGSSTAIPVVTVNAKGLVTAVSTATVAGGQYFGTATTKAIAYNANSISENITVTAGNNGLSAGPITINTGYTVTVATGANWVIV